MMLERMQSENVVGKGELIAQHVIGPDQGGNVGDTSHLLSIAFHLSLRQCSDFVLPQT